MEKENFRMKWQEQLRLRFLGTKSIDEIIKTAQKKVLGEVGLVTFREQVDSGCEKMYICAFLGGQREFIYESSVYQIRERELYQKKVAELLEAVKKQLLEAALIPNVEKEDYR